MEPAVAKEGSTNRGPQQYLDKTSKTLWGLKGLVTKSFAPDFKASTMRLCCPMELHITHVADGSSAMIFLSASIPSLAIAPAGITMSNKTRSGLCCRYSTIASSPVPASAITSCPAWRTIRFSMFLMNEASSAIRTPAMVVSLQNLSAVLWCFCVVFSLGSHLPSISR